MSNNRILVIKHIDCEGLGSFEPHLKEMGFIPVTVCGYKGEEIPQSDKEFHALILLGGPIGVYETEKYPFLKEEMILVKNFHESGKAILGICLGAQLIAEALGGKVYKGMGKEIGWYHINFTAEGRMDPIFSDMPDTPMVFQWHGDTFELPHGAQRLAFSYMYPNQAFRIKNNIYGIQFHIEVTEDMVSEWMDKYRDELKNTDGVREDILLKKTLLLAPGLEKYAENFITHFIKRMD